MRRDTWTGGARMESAIVTVSSNQTWQLKRDRTAHSPASAPKPLLPSTHCIEGSEHSVLSAQAQQLESLLDGLGTPQTTPVSAQLPPTLRSYLRSFFRQHDQAFEPTDTAAQQLICLATRQA
ncbi:unnamed protein product [Parajaminaea phylloscopi]